MSTAEHTARAARALDVETIARRTVWIILAYFAAQLAIRVGLSGNLETDEAQFVGHTHFAPGYGNSHPPLYNWLVAGALWITGSWAGAVAIVKTAFLAGTYLCIYDAGRRISGRHLTGLIVAASLLFLPQIVWQSQVTLAHSVMVMFGVAATLHAVMLIRDRGRLVDFLWLGVAISIGGYAKYNYFFALVAIFLAAYTVGQFRERLFTIKLIWPAVFFTLVYMPHAVWAISNISETTQRMARLDSERTVFSIVDLPILGIDGLFEIGIATLAWAGPLAAVWFSVWWLTSTERSDGLDGDRAAAARFFARVTLLSVALFALLVLLGDFHSVDERYMTPLLMALPLWLAAAWPLELHGRAPVHFLRTAGVLVVLMLIVWPGLILFGKEKLAFPYPQFAAEMRDETSGRISVIGSPNRIGANLVIRLDNARMWSREGKAQRVLLAWEGHSSTAPRKMVKQLGPDYAPADAVRRLTAVYDNFSGRKARLSYQVFQRSP